MITVLVGIFDTVRNQIIVRIAVQRIGVRADVVSSVAAGFDVVADTVVIRVGVRVELPDVVAVVYSVVVVVRVGFVDFTVIIKITSGKSRQRVTLVERVGALGDFRAVVDAVRIRVGVQRVGFAGVLCTVLVGVFRTVGQSVAVRVGVQRVGINAGIIAAVTARFDNVADAVVVRVGVRIERCRIVNVRHTVAVIVEVGAVDRAVIIKITNIGRKIGDTGVVIVGVEIRVGRQEISGVAVVVVVFRPAGRVVRVRVTGIERIGFVICLVKIGNAVAVRVGVWVKLPDVVAVIDAVVVVVRVGFVDFPVIIKITSREGGCGVAEVERIGFSVILHTVLVGIFFAVGQSVAVRIGTQRVGFPVILCAVLVGVFRAVGN